MMRSRICSPYGYPPAPLRGTETPEEIELHRAESALFEARRLSYEVDRTLTSAKRLFWASVAMFFVGTTCMAIALATVGS